ncbi:uncharacterized protein LOC132546242 [Ylistrum balloti]|uniref:uncharacterized protein LOC132546242 n=1 Tax=Ylistrum balloti TaxID=509963 RepID=UPI002905C1DF|nr:uncharacterized protein LOC132546242 [Ylistrum balloti]
MAVRYACLVLVFCLAGYGSSAPAVDTDISTSSSNKIQSLESKLSKLRSLLADIAKSPESKNKKSDDETKSSVSKMATESNMSRDKDEKSQRNLKLAGDSTMTAGLAGLQGETLEALLLALQTLKDQQQHQNKQRTTADHRVDMGSFREEPIQDPVGEKNKDSDVVELAKLLTADKPDHTWEGNDGGYRQPKEGRFGLFRGEALRLVEDKLLGDVELALESGLTLEEIMQDLERQEEKSRTRDLLSRLAEQIPRQYRD